MLSRKMSEGEGEGNENTPPPPVVEISTVNFNNFLVIWDKVSLDESDIVHTLTQIQEIRYLSLIHISEPRDGLLSRMPSSA